MTTTNVAIVGGGLSGLYAASLLESRGIDCVLVEARETVGGRVQSCTWTDSCEDSAEHNSARFDLGATWFWPANDHQFASLVTELGLQFFEQRTSGDMVFERTPHSAPTRMRGYASSPPSMRIAGGMQALIDAVAYRVENARLHCAERVCRITLEGDNVEIEAEDASGSILVYRAKHVMLAVPPRLAAATIEFRPALPEAIARQWLDTPTWMAPHAKYVAIYDEPFWIADGLSGEARSMAGPLAEIHDASSPGGKAALFGFVGLPAGVRKRIPEAALRESCKAQLVRLFGAAAGHPAGEYLKDWCADPHTATAADMTSGEHPVAPRTSATEGIWQGRLVGIASEWSPTFSGYLAGAIDAASRGVSALSISQRQITTTQ
jgi:monoamine oxidase